MTMLIMSQDHARPYSTALFNDRAHAIQSGLPTVPVRVAFLCETYNVYHQRNECVFACFLNEDDKSLIGTYFQNALRNFGE